MDCFLRPIGTVTGAEDEDSSCLTSGVFSEDSSGVVSCGVMMVSETSPVEVDIVCTNPENSVNTCSKVQYFGQFVVLSSALLAGKFYYDFFV